MTRRSWVRTLFARTPRAARQAPARCRPAVEALEDRLAPAVLTVNSTADDTTAGDQLVTLREAIAAANGDSATDLGQAGSGADAIVFDPALFATPQTITLSGALGITESLTITGPAAGLTVVGARSDNIFVISGGAFAVDRVVEFRALTLTGAGRRFGGAINNEEDLTLINCTLWGNSAAEGGGLINYGKATLINCTLQGNTAGLGGGLWNAGVASTPHPDAELLIGEATLINCTVSGNSASSGGGGVGGSGGTKLTLYNTIVANNSAPRDADISGSYTGSHNLTGAVPLGDLADNGGSTRTMALPADSPALNAGDNARVPADLSDRDGDGDTAEPDPFDQRGSGFARVSGGAVDIGAFEAQQNTAPSVALANTTTSLAEDASTTSAVKVADIVVTDDALGTNELSLSGADAALFEVVGTGLYLRAGTTLDFETNPRLDVTVHVDDTAVGGTPDGSVPLAISVTDVNEGPAVALPAAQIAYEDVGQAVSGITVGDVDSASLTVTLSVSRGTLALGTTAGLTVSGNGTGAVTLSGSIAALNAALAGLVYRGGLNYSGSDALSVTASDGSLSTTGSVAITVKSAAQQAQELRARVDGLRSEGVLSRGVAAALKATLDLKGNAADVLRAGLFLLEVKVLRWAGVLTAAQANDLLGPGSTLLLSVKRR
jgi:hypothetical protein